MTLHFMVDLETLDTTPTAKVTALAVVAFDPWGLSPGPVVDRYRVVDWQSQTHATTSQSTWSFWHVTQPPALREEILYASEASNQTPRVSMAEALRVLFEFYKDYASDGSLVFSNGADFDIPILNHHAATLGVPLPWNFRSIRCYRTLTSTFPTKETPPARTTLEKVFSEDFLVKKHHPTADCISQIRRLLSVTAEHKKLIFK